MRKHVLRNKRLHDFVFNISPSVLVSRAASLSIPNTERSFAGEMCEKVKIKGIYAALEVCKL